MQYIMLWTGTYRTSYADWTIKVQLHVYAKWKCIFLYLTNKSQLLTWSLQKGEAFSVIIEVHGFHSKNNWISVMYITLFGMP